MDDKTWTEEINGIEFKFTKTKINGKPLHYVTYYTYTIYKYVVGVEWIELGRSTE